MLKLITLAACVIGFVFLGPKAWAEFRQARPQPRTRVSNNAENKDTPKKSRSSRRLPQSIFHRDVSQSLVI